MSDLTQQALTALAVGGTIGLVAYTVMDTGPGQHTVQQMETTGDVRRLCIEAKTGERIDAMSCDLIDPHTGGVAK